MQDGGLVSEQEELTATHSDIEQDAARAPDNEIFVQDVIIKASLCTGNDCLTNEAFFADTLRFKENNLRIHFDDSSNSGSFPGNDWRIIINDTANGGANYFAVENDTSGVVPFTISDSAIANSLYIMEAGGTGWRANQQLELYQRQR